MTAKQPTTQRQQRTAQQPRPTPVAATPRAPLTLDVPWRPIGDVPADAWRAILPSDSPLLADLDRVLAAASPHGAVAAGQAIEESSGGTDGAGVPLHNPLGLMEPDGSTLMGFPDWPDAFAEFSRRLESRTYKGGIYFDPRAASLLGYCQLFVGGPGCWDDDCANGETPERVRRYATDLVVHLNRLLGIQVAPPRPSLVPWPARFERKIATKRPDSSGNGWHRVPNRAPGMCAVVWHITDGGEGFGKDECWALFSIGGEREHDALTEAVVDRDGSGYLMNDPWSKNPLDGSGRSPWASGPATGLEGPGVPFVSELGADAVNTRGFSIELCNKEGEPFGDALLDGVAKVSAVAITREGIPWDRWPYNDAVGGLYVALTHADIAPKACPGWKFVRQGVRDALIRATAYEAKLLQTGSAPPGPVPVPPPPAPEPVWPLGFTQGEVTAAWGVLTRHLVDGSTRAYPADPRGPLFNVWLARAKRELRFPRALDWWEDAAGANWVTFGDPGDTDWVLSVPSLTGRADWRWVDRPDVG